MKITVKAKTGSTRINFPWIPDKISFKSGGMELATYDIQDFGKVARPAGTGLRTVAWEGIFPGRARVGHPFLTGEWKKPGSYQGILNKWRRDKVLLKLTISETPIDMYCYLDNYDMDYKEGFGDYYYKVSFTEYRPVHVKTKKKKQKTGKSRKQAGGAGIRRPASGKSTYRVKKGDDLFKIARKYLGSGSRWKEIYQLNRAAIEKAAKQHGKSGSKNGALIYAGTKLKLPKK